MRLKKVYNPYGQIMKVLEQKENEVTILILTRSDEDRGSTAKEVQEYCDKKGFACFNVFSDEAFMFDKEAGDGELIIHNFDGQEKKLRLDPSSTACLVRGSVMDNEAGQTLLRNIQEAGVFMANTSEAMNLARNKLLTSVSLKKDGIPHPRTSFVSNEKSIDLAVEAVGGEFPVIVKTLTGTEGRGVIKVESKETLPSVLQALWSEEAELLVQEYIPIDFDFRTLVLAGEIVGTTMRKKIKDDFRTNLSLGADTSPYKLGDEDREMVLAAAESMGTYFAGVDHIVTKKRGEKERFVLEVNGSPGTQSNFGLENKKTTPREKIIASIIDSIRDKTTWKGFSPKEAKDVEEVNIKGIGKVAARLDTGNKSYNALHATDIQIKGNEVTFRTVNNKTLTAKIVDKVEIQASAADKEVETRPVIELDMIFDGALFKKAKFSLTNREGHLPVLVGVKFLSRSDTSVNVNK